jgi:hypothetical protein
MELFLFFMILFEILFLVAPNIKLLNCSWMEFGAYLIELPFDQFGIGKKELSKSIKKT